MAVGEPVNRAARAAAVARAIDLMRQDLSAPRCLDELARAALFSPFHFHRVFTEVTGITPARFLTWLRIAESRRLLLRSSRPVVHISTAVGYGSVGTFTSQFTRLVGEPPGAFRRLAHAVLQAVPAHRDPATPSLVVSLAAGATQGWTLWSGAGLPATRPPGEYRIRAILVRPGRGILDALVDRDPDSYRMADGVIRFDDGCPPSVVRLHQRAPAPTDLPVLTAQPLRQLTGRPA
jgi:AraC-like DNA-binding protein